MNRQDQDPPDRLIDAKELHRLIPVSSMTIWRWERDQRFPARIRIGANRVAWRLSEILAWIDEKADAREPHGQFEASLPVHQSTSERDDGR